MRTLFANGQVFDGTGSAPAAADVVVEDGRIVDVGPGSTATSWSTRRGDACCPGSSTATPTCMMSGVDLARALSTPFSLPFFEAIGNLRTTVECGITSVRDAGGADLGVAEAVRRGLDPGPRMQISITPLSQTGGHGDGWWSAASPLDVAAPRPADGDRRRAGRGPQARPRGDPGRRRRHQDHDSGGVLSPRDDPRHGHFRDDEIAMMVAEATAAGMFVMSHAQAAEGIKAAVRNGVRSIEHGIYLDDEGIELMLDRGAWLVPTLVAPRAVLEQRRRPAAPAAGGAGEGADGAGGAHRVGPAGDRAPA